jgi:glycosyl transferase, family 25
VIVDLINLDRFTERRQEFMTVNAHLSEVRRCALFDGRDLDIEALIANGTITRDVTRTYNAGTLGGALAQISLWERAIAANETITICEDDAIFYHQFERAAEAIIGQLLPADWDIILYGWNFDAALVIDLLPGVTPAVVYCDEDRLRAHAAQFQHHTQPLQAIRLRQAFGPMCYSVSPKGARAMRNLCLPIRPLTVDLPGPDRNLQPARRLPNVGLDVMMAAAYPQVNAFVAFPPLVVSKNEHAASTVRHLPTLAGAGAPDQRATRR